jgi:signal transduction histidine kinase
MRFWQKAFIGILVVFIIALNICLYLTSKYSFSLNMDRDTDRALGEYYVIINGLSETMNSIYYREQLEMSAPSLESLMRSYAAYYKKQHVSLKLTNASKTIFTNIPDAAAHDIDLSNPPVAAYTMEVISGDEKTYLSIYGEIAGPYESYNLLYVRDLSELYSAHAQLVRYLIIVSTSVEAVLTLVLLLLLRKLTHPITILQTATRKIAGGIYTERIYLPGTDEFHNLAEHFNQMASSIQEKINALDKNAKDKQRLVDNLAHELRTPLTAIRGYGEYLQNAHTSEANRIKAAAYIVSETARMENLSFKLLDLALIRNSPLDLQPLIPLELFHQAEAILQTKLQLKRIKLISYASLNQLTGDSVLLQSLLINLIDNAIKASPNDSSIHLSAYFDTVPIFEVKDFGCGMDEEQTTLVYEPFYRVDKARSRSAGGIGLGLSLCLEIAHLHGAELKINSIPGKGTNVTMYFTTCLQPSENPMPYSDV